MKERKPSLVNNPVIYLSSTLPTIWSGSTGQPTSFKETLLICDRLIDTTEKLRPHTPRNRYSMTRGRKQGI